MSRIKKHIWRLAPRILIVCVLLHSSTLILAIQPKQLSKMSFLTHTCINKGHSPPRIRPYNKINIASKHTKGFPVLYSALKPSIFDKFEYPKNEKSILTKIFDYIVSYLSNKLSILKANAAFNRSRYLPLFSHYLRNKRMNRLSLFDFFESSESDPNNLKIKDRYEKILSRESPYMELVTSGPSRIINSFLKLAPNIVKDAVSLTVSTMIGSFYKYSAETTMITTADHLAALIMNLQVTGYIYCNAEQRYRLSRLYEPSDKKETAVINTEPKTANSLGPDSIVEVEPVDELINYVRKLPPAYVNSVFENMNPSIFEAMRISTQRTVQLLTDAAAVPTYDDYGDPNKRIIQQTGTFAIQLCFWKLALGYCMRHTETKIELSKSLNAH